MIRLRPYKPFDAETVLSWCRDESTFYNWTAGVLGPYPLTKDRFEKTGELIRFTALSDKTPVGFFTARNPGGSPDELRFGFVIVDPTKRCVGVGREMLGLGLRFARDVYRAKRVSLGVFKDNLPAIRCYSAAGFIDVTPSSPETYEICGELRRCREMLFDFEKEPRL